MTLAPAMPPAAIRAPAPAAPAARPGPSRSPPAGSRRREAGLTLLEILLVLALIGVFGGLFTVGVSALLPRDGDQATLEEKFWTAVAAARQQAVLGGQPVRLLYDGESRGFVTRAQAPSRPPTARPADDASADDAAFGGGFFADASDPATAAEGDAPAGTVWPAAYDPDPPVSYDDADQPVRFLRLVPEARRYLVGGQLVTTAPATSVLFRPDGTCTPFVVEFASPQGQRRQIAIDPWTCAEETAAGDAR